MTRGSGLVSDADDAESFEKGRDHGGKTEADTKPGIRKAIVRRAAIIVILNVFEIRDP